MKTIDSTYQILEGITVAYSFFYKFFGDEAPTKDELELLKENAELFNEWPMQQSEDSKEGLALIKQAMEDLSDDSIAMIQDNHMKLFIGPVSVIAPPWESVYLEHDGTIFGQSTLKVREIYRQHGLQIPNVNKEPDDHVRFEAAFVNYICMQAIEALEKENFPVYDHLIQALRDFMNAHMNVWVPEFAKTVSDKSFSDFYKGVGLLLSGTIKETESMIDRIS